jgi:hypothetical protein
MMDMRTASDSFAGRTAQTRGAGSAHAVCSFLRQLMAFGRVMRIYADGHRRIQENMRQLKTVADELIGARADGVTLEVRTTGLRVEGRSVHQEPALVEAFSEVLRVRGIRMMNLVPGITEEELHLLADLLSKDARELREEGGAEAKLSGESHPHFSLYAAAHKFGRFDVDDLHPEEADAGEEEIAVQQLEELLGEQGEMPEEPKEEIRLVYTAVGNDELGSRSPELVAMAEETLIRQKANHDIDFMAALSLCDMVGRSSDELEYNHRRDLLRSVVSERRLDVAALRIAQLHLTHDLPDWPCEPPTALLLELGASASDTELLKRAMGTCKMTKAEARGIAERIALRPDSFDLLSVLLSASLPVFIRVPLEDVLTATIRHDQRTFRQWALDKPKKFLNGKCFAFLLGNAGFAMGPIVKEYLLSDQTERRERVIDLLVENGSEEALRLLVMGVRYDGDAQDLRLISAFGKFEHPLAVAMLREIVHRCNTIGSSSDEEVESAVNALAQSGSNDAHDFLEEISQMRVGLLPLYRRSIRALAQEAMLVA